MPSALPATPSGVPARGQHNQTMNWFRQQLIPIQVSLGKIMVGLPAKNKVVPVGRFSVLLVNNTGRTHRDEEFKTICADDRVLP